jgi:hypothetical protein
MQWKLQWSDRILLDVMAKAILGENQGNAVRADETPRSRADDSTISSMPPARARLSTAFRSSPEGVRLVVDSARSAIVRHSTRLFHR